ncbi:hypothetical protein [Nocardia mangyaensis]|uniref:hypothetical protein n=1 Tax=Nocardia mangyaensis TaxID=2213200 RepID=UPI002676920A|nr:hypothetical protein [Nocardia mangyaensis]MDO3650846.1 hypothetical protein [Nocardia mangyaensis]
MVVQPSTARADRGGGRGLLGDGLADIGGKSRSGQEIYKVGDEIDIFVAAHDRAEFDRSRRPRPHCKGGATEFLVHIERGDIIGIDADLGTTRGQLGAGESQYPCIGNS